MYVMYGKVYDWVASCTTTVMLTRFFIHSLSAVTDGDSEEEVDAEAWAQQGGGEQGGPSRQNSSQVARNDARARAARLAASGPTGSESSYTMICIHQSSRLVCLLKCVV